MNKICFVCGESKEIFDYYVNRSKKDGRDHYCKKCRSKDARNWALSHSGNMSLRQKKYKISLNGILSRKVNNARSRARNKKLVCDITPKFIRELYDKQEGKCALTGFEMTILIGKGRQYRNISIDRIDSSSGYSKNNVQLVCFIANVMKYNLSQDKLVEYCSAIVNKLKQ